MSDADIPDQSAPDQPAPDEQLNSAAYREWLREAMFAEVGDDALSALMEEAEQRTIAGGAHLVEQGQPANCLFFVQTGRFRVLIAGADGNLRQVAQIEAGEPVGELAFFGGGTRTATLQASRDSVVLALDRTAYDRVAAKFPQVTAALLKSVSMRLADVTARTPKMDVQPPRVIAVLPAAGTVPAPDFLPRVAAAMRRSAGDAMPVDLVGAGDVPSRDRNAYQQWLYAREAEGGYLLIDASGDPAWSDLATRNADALVMIGTVGHDPSPNEAEEKAFRWIWPENRTLVMLRETADTPISGTAAWIAPREPHLHHHVALDREGDIARLARFLTGRAVGLVLAGGGALGSAHLGVVRGLKRCGVPIDYIGGTSAGAAMGGAIALGLSVADTLDQLEDMFIHAKAMKRLTVPVHSLLDPAVFDAELRARYTACDLVDLSIGFFAISTNLSTNNLHVHRDGPLWEAVRASGSLPTILPPFVDSDGNILVDGGVLDNIPVVTMRKIKAGPNIVVTLGDSGNAWRIAAQYGDLRSRAGLIRDVLLRRKAPDDFPSIVEIMQRSMVVASRIASRSMLAPGDAMLTPPILDGMQILDWHLGRSLAQDAALYVEQRFAEDEVLQAMAGLEAGTGAMADTEAEINQIG